MFTFARIPRMCTWNHLWMCFMLEISLMNRDVLPESSMYLQVHFLLSNDINHVLFRDSMQQKHVVMH